MEDANLATGSEKENINANNDFSSQETLRANPILANLLKSGVPPTNFLSNLPEMTMPSVFDASNVLSVENQIMTALAANMESYIRNLSNLLSVQPKNGEDINSNDSDQEEDDTDPEQHNSDQEQHDSDQERHNSDQELHNSDQELRDYNQQQHDSDQEQHNNDKHTHNLFQGDQNSHKYGENSDSEKDYLNDQISNDKHNNVMDRNNDFVRNGHISDQSVQNSEDIDEDVHNIDIDGQNNKLNDQTFDNDYQNDHQEDQNSGNSQNYKDDQNYSRDFQNLQQDENSSYKNVQSFNNVCQNYRADNSDNDYQSYNHDYRSSDQNYNDNQDFDKIGQMLESKGSIVNECSEPNCDN